MVNRKDPPLCVNCEHCKPALVAKHSRCGRPGLEEMNLVTGESVFPKCEDERIGQDWIDAFIEGRRCGPEGRFFVEKP